jgi:predicted nucleic acid-binding protein
MNAAFVMDCSITMAWLFREEATPRTEQLLDCLSSETAVVPAWWALEVTNVIAIAERKRRITTSRSQGFLHELSELGIEYDDLGAARAFSHVLTLCRSHQLTSYDALYLDLAMRRGLPLATLDMSLRKAARKSR